MECDSTLIGIGLGIIGIGVAITLDASNWLFEPKKVLLGRIAAGGAGFIIIFGIYTMMSSLLDNGTRATISAITMWLLLFVAIALETIIVFKSMKKAK